MPTKHTPNLNRIVITEESINQNQKAFTVNMGTDTKSRNSLNFKEKGPFKILKKRATDSEPQKSPLTESEPSLGTPDLNKGSYLQDVGRQE